MHENDRPRTLVLGSTGHGHLVSSYEWGSLPPGLNVADFDLVILNFAPFVDAARAESQDIEELPEALDFIRLLFSRKGEIVAIGTPDLYLGSNPFIKTDYWLPAIPRIERSTGVSISRVNRAWQFYFDQVKRYDFYTSNKVTRKEPYVPIDLTEFDPLAVEFFVSMSPLAETRFHQPIAFALQIILVREASGRTMSNYEEGRKSNLALWLPAPTEIAPQEAIDLLLAERYAIAKKDTTPDWVVDYPLPKMEPIALDIDRTQRQIEELRLKLEEDRQKLDAARRFTMLLYETGQGALEPVVRDAFRVLGARVDEPTTPGREDGRLSDPEGRRAILEIKGRTGPLKLSDVRQLDQWVRDTLAEGWDGKGLLVANLLSQVPPSERRDVVPDNCARTANRFGLCILTTAQLFRAVVNQQLGSLDVKGFWDAVMECDGPCSLPEHELS